MLTTTTSGSSSAPGLHVLEQIAGARLRHEDERVHERRHLGLALSDAHRLDDDEVEGGGEHEHAGACALREAAEPIARGERAQEHAGVAGARAHAHAIAEERAAAPRARGIDGEDADRLAPRARAAHERVEQRGLAGAGRAGEAEPRRPGEEQRLLERDEQRERLGARLGPPVVHQVQRRRHRVALAREQAPRELLAPASGQLLSLASGQDAPPRRRPRSRP